MLRIGQVEPSATADGKYTDGSVAGGIAATRLRAAAFNAMQEELANIVESAGMILSPDDMTQVLTALKKQLLSRANPFADIKADGPAAVAAALSNLGLSDVMKTGDFGLGVKNETKPGGMAALGV
ncbi:gp53-like domain-containing protein, partial [Citrobacter freundii]